MSCFITIPIGIFLYVFYIYVIKPAFYWQKRGVIHEKLWNSAFFKMMLCRKSFPEIQKEEYDKFTDRRYYGGYQLLKPMLCLRDLDLIKRVTIKDFVEHFPDHMKMLDEQVDPLMGGNLMSLKGQRWKDMRSTLSPAFTSSKMRAMYELISEAAENFAQFFLAKNEEVIEMEFKKVFTKYSNDVIASCAFGIKCNSLEDEGNDFYIMGQGLTKISASKIVRGMLMAVFPAVFRFFRISMFPSKITTYFKTIIMKTISVREENHIVRPDMIHLLMEAKKGRLNHETIIDQPKEGFATVEESSIGKTTTNKIQLTDNLITAQALIFFFAGFESSSTLMSFLFHELASNPDIQQKLQAEIDEIRGNKGKISYENIFKMKYLDQVVSETLRKYPPSILMDRLCVNDYAIPAKNPNETDLVLEKDCLVIVPVYSIHHDPKYFPRPHQFDPDRFSEENKGKIVPGSYIPFGSGPRSCIGSRFALLESKALIASLLSVFDVVPTKKTVIPLRLSTGLGMGCKDGFWLGFKRRSFDNN